MSEIWAYLPGEICLLLMSGFFSGSEAAFFSLTPSQRRGLSQGTPAERLAFQLLSRSEQLLMGILFWNLAINIVYFSLLSRSSLATSSETLAAAVSLLGLLAMILFGEFLPKSVAVTYPLTIVRLVVLPLRLAMTLTGVFLPLVKLVNEASRRLLWPGFKAEPYLELSDLDRAVELSTDDAQLYEQESQVLRNVIRLSEIRVEEWMRPRTQYRTFMPPVSLEQLGGEKTPSGYMLVTDPRGLDIVSVIDLAAILPGDTKKLAKKAKPPVVVPWCCTIADALKQLKDEGLRVALVVNEYGDTIGILTWEEIIEAILQSDKAPSHRELAIAEIHADGDDSWVATGMTKLRRLERVIGRRLSVEQGLTIGGVLQEHLHRLPELGDVCQFDGLQLEVLDAGMRGEVLVRISTLQDDEVQE